MKNLLLSLLVTMSILMPTTSKAIVGIATDSEATAIAGLALMDLSQIWIIDGRSTTYRNGRRGWERTTYVTYRVITYPAFLIAGLVLLDEQGSAEISAELTQEQISEAGITKEELEAFQSEIEEINAIKDLIASEIGRIPDESEKIYEAGKLWTDYSELLSPSAAIALGKLSQFND